MKILMINSVCGTGSTGRICTDLAGRLEELGNEVKIAYGRRTVPKEYEKYAIKIGGVLNFPLHSIYARLFDTMGLGSVFATKRFIKWVEEYNPDIIHLHNIHGYYINYPVLFDYLKKSDKKIIWTLHDCWSFTGHCSHFECEECYKWQEKDGCHNCPNKNNYPKRMFIDRSQRNFRLKKELFTGIKNLTVITPSTWLEELVKKSFLGEYPVYTVHNGINTDIFKPVAEKSNKKTVLGVSSVWSERKGLSDFIMLRKLLPDEYKIVLVGLNDKQISSLPDGITGIKRTDGVRELAEYYSSAFVFVNPTYEDTFPTTNLEAISCGTPVITYETGGSTESALIYGCAVKKRDVNALADKIINGAFAFDKSLSYDFGTERFIGEYLRFYK